MEEDIVIDDIDGRMEKIIEYNGMMSPFAIFCRQYDIFFLPCEYELNCC